MNYSIIEIGHLALILGLPIALLQGLLPLLGVPMRAPLFMQSGRLFALFLCLLMTLAFICLSYAFAQNDFSVALVSNHSNTALPWYYKLSAVWGNHEGSLLLWALVLSIWGAWFALASNNIPADIRARVLGVLGLISVGFIAFIIFTSNPFERNLINPPLEGADLNPLLQDVGLILHPPLLYIGYVGFAVPFAFAIAALLSGRLDAAWVRWVKPWTNFAWSFLTLGIALGSWWAYYELGWGGWWFWDPVENASFMPWLSGTALLHSLAATEKRGVFRNWTVLLAILTFSLSLMGTFLVRSGILVSVHAFATDPTRGLFILAFLVIVIGSSLTLYALRASTIKPLSSFSLVSRESGILSNNLILSVALLVVLLGTLFPLIAVALDWGSYSVGPPYFNRMFVPLMLVLLVLVAFAPYLNWKTTHRLGQRFKHAIIVAFVSVVSSAMMTAELSRRYEQPFELLALLIGSLAFWVLWMTLWHTVASKPASRDLFTHWRKHAISYWGMILAHCGLAISALGILYTVTYSQQHDVRMQVGDSATLGGLSFVMTGLDQVAGPNYTATRGMLEIRDNAGVVALLQPEKRLYHAGKNVMTEAGIAWTIGRDLYVSLGEQLQPGAWAVRLYIKVYVRLIWLGAIFMALGAGLAAMDKRFKSKSRESAKDNTSQASQKPANAMGVVGHGG